MDDPEKLRRICLRKFTSLLKSDQVLWKRQLEERVDQYYQEEKSQSTLNPTDQQKRKQRRGESFRIDEESVMHSIDHPSNETRLPHRTFFIEYFLRGHCPLNPMLSEHLLDYLTTHDQLNDFTLSLFASNVTCLRRFVINGKYLSRLQCHILNQHPNLSELEITFKDSTSSRTIKRANEIFYQHICPSIYSTFEEIYTIYGPFLLYHRYSRPSSESRRASASNNNILERLPNSSDEFSHHKLLNAIFSNLHPVTIERLKHLSISHYKFFAATYTTPARKYSLADMSPSSKCAANPSCMTTPVSCMPTNLRLLLKFTNLTSLNLSATDIKNPCFDIIIDSLENLDTLDVSMCRSIKQFHSLLKLSSKLKWLNLYNCHFHMQQNPTIYHILYQLNYLEHLDICNDNAFSDSYQPVIDSESDINKFLRQADCLPRLKHLDISGQRTISSMSLSNFLLNHPSLQFLGLFLTNEKYSQYIFDPNDICYSKYRQYTIDLEHIPSIALTENDVVQYEPYLLSALTRYDDRSGFVQKILSYIFFLTRSFQPIQQNLLIEQILHVMSTHSNSQAVQMASTATIYNLTRTSTTRQVPRKYLAQIVQAIMNVMSTFPNHQQLQKNCLLALCSDRILHEPHFHFYRLAKLVMNDLLNFTDLAIIQPAVAILSLLTTRLTTTECAQLGSLVNLKRLLEIVEQQIDRLQTVQISQNQQVPNVVNDQSQPIINDTDIMLNNAQQLTSDDTLRFCLSLLWNLTDENIVVCEHFIQSMGLDLSQRLLHLFTTDTIVLTKIVGLLSNIAEISHLKSYLYSIDIISLMQKLISEGIPDIIFSATGILAHLLYEQHDEEINYELCEQTREAIVTWRTPHTNMVTYRSFKPFFPLLYCTRIPVVQLWAIWAIHHVCSTDHARYSRLIRDEKISELIEKIYDDHLSSSSPDTFLLQLLQSLLYLLKSYHSNHHQNSPPVAS